jgi:DeoR/GlpR family transcriptional regulator of sugar metabolism
VVRICGPESLDHIVTDEPIPHASRATLAASSIEVTIA